ncbi:unnamed protein product [Rhodiola kirilowii]
MEVGGGYAGSEAIEDAVKLLLESLDEDVNREGLKKTPFRVAKALREGTRGYRQKVKDIVQDALFPEAGLDNLVGHAGGSGGLVVVRDLDLFSYCESCLLPFQVKCHVGYVPSGLKVVGLSKLSRVADVFAKRLQDPPRLANEVCSALQHVIKPEGVAVILQCLHLRFPSSEPVIHDCMHEANVKVTVSSGSGVFNNKKAGVWEDFISLLRFRGINVSKPCNEDVTVQSWCPSKSSQSSLTSDAACDCESPKLVAAVSSIIRSLGENPSRKELLETPKRFLKWLMTFRSSNLDLKLNGYVHVKMDCGQTNGIDTHNSAKIQSELNLSFWSQCEHHLLPFYGVVHLGYISDDKVNPKVTSLLQSMVHYHGFKLQVQERLTRQIAETVSPLLGPDVIVVAEANHTCMISRGIEKFGSSTATVALLGRFSTEPSLRSMFLETIPKSTIS